MASPLVLFGHDLGGLLANRPSNASEGQMYFDDSLGIWLVYSGSQWNTVPGLLSRQISSTGVNPGATGADNVLAAYSLPAKVLDVASRGLYVSAWGSFAATANNKEVKLIWNPATAVVGSTVGAGGTVLADTGVVATNNGGWFVGGNATKYGANGSNTQLCTSDGAIAGAVHAGMSKPALATATESGAILVAVTGNATTAATDIVFNQLDVWAVG